MSKQASEDTLAPSAPPSSAARRRQRRPRGGQDAKVKAKVDAYLAEGKFYEAQQLYHTMYNRLSVRGQHDEAVSLLQPGIKQLLQKQQANAGGELALKLVESLTAAARPVTPETLSMLLEIAHEFPDMAAAAPAKTAFLKAAITWSGRFGSGAHGDPQLHRALAHHLTVQNDFSSAQRYWLRSSDPEGHARCLALWSRKGYRGERDLFIARAVLQYCALENLRDAHGVLASYQRETQGDGLDTPLMHFLNFLLQTLQRDAQPLFEMLREKYARALARDPGMKSYLDKIGQVYYNIQAPKGMMDEILGMLKA